MRKKLIVELQQSKKHIAEQQCQEQPLAMMQYCIDVVYGNLQHDPTFGPNCLDGLRQIQKDIDHMVSVAAGDPPSSTKRSSLLRQLAASTEFNSVSNALIEKAERMERQAEGLRYKYSRDRRKKGI